jgi:hypothetical protein
MNFFMMARPARIKAMITTQMAKNPTLLFKNDPNCFKGMFGYSLQ